MAANEAPTMAKRATIKMISVYPSQGISLVGADLPKAVVNGRVVFGKRVSGKRVDFVENYADVPVEYMEFTSETTGEPAGIKHTNGYGQDFVEKDKFVADLKKKLPWAESFFQRMNRRRSISTPALPPIEKIDLFA
jgi:acyl-coenzyme A synthetase/AMP-(fatty) acid ligase